MLDTIKKTIQDFSEENISIERRVLLQPLVDYVQSKKEKKETVRLNFICTHNSRRSHLSQIWAQTLAYYFGVKDVICYSGGTEATAMYPKIVETLTLQGFLIQQLSEAENSVYFVKYADNEAPVICFSKTYSHAFNPTTNFGAIMTCDNADEGCPIVFGAEARLPIKYNDPKDFDNTDKQNEKYAERSIEIAQEMWWVFKNVHHK